MKRTLAYVLLLACAATAVRCDEKPEATEWSSDLEEMTYTSYWYYTYEALETLGHEAMGLAEAADFNPYTVAQRGDTLFVANIGAAGNSLILYSKRERRPLTTIKTWQFDGTEKNFGSWIEAMSVTGERLYISERQSRIHVFALPGMEYVTCIGNGDWNQQVFQAQAMTVKDGLVFARDKNGTVSVYKESDATPENYQKIKRYKRAAANEGNASNNAFGAHYMETDAEGRILLTAYEAQTIRVLDPSLVDDGFADGTSIDIKELTWELAFHPKTFATSPERMYATGSNDAINVYDYAQKEWVKALKSIKGFAFSIPTRIFAQDGQTFWVSDTNKKILVKMGVFKGEIREYEPVTKNVVKVRAAKTRSGEENGEFYVDLRTHEIVDPAE